MKLHPTLARAEQALKNASYGFEDFEEPLGQLIKSTIQDGFVTDTDGDLPQIIRDLRNMSGELLTVADALEDAG